MYSAVTCLLVLAGAVSPSTADRWVWPEPSGERSLRIDTKVRFTDEPRNNNRQSDEVPFETPTDTDGFYNRPSDSGRYPVTVEAHSTRRLPSTGEGRYPVTVETHGPGRQSSARRPATLQELATRPASQQYTRLPQNYESSADQLSCKCLTTSECNLHPSARNACGSGMFLCCSKRPNKEHQAHSELFNEIDDMRPMLFPGQERVPGVFPPAPGPAAETPAVLAGPGGPTGVVGPPQDQRQDQGFDSSAQRGVLVGPGGPTGIIGPGNRRPVLVGPGGPTGIIGPGRGGQRGVLLGQGIVGPGYGRRQQGPGVLVGPGGPTGIIGPGRRLLVGPGGPTGNIGPGYFSI